ncbi:hypothetical protein BDW68DRAFT_164309 [Aspergillus falconensis]
MSPKSTNMCTASLECWSSGCSGCSFSTTRALTRHQRQTHCDGLVKCCSCSKGFTRKRYTCHRQTGRLRQACNFCRKRKIKCSGRPNCTNCEQRNIACEFQLQRNPENIDKYAVVQTDPQPEPSAIKTINPSLEDKNCGDLILQAQQETGEAPWFLQRNQGAWYGTPAVFSPWGDPFAAELDQRGYHEMCNQANFLPQIAPSNMRVPDIYTTAPIPGYVPVELTGAMGCSLDAPYDLLLSGPG